MFTQGSGDKRGISLLPAADIPETNERDTFSDDALVQLPLRALSSILVSRDSLARENRELHDRLLALGDQRSDTEGVQRVGIQRVRGG